MHPKWAVSETGQWRCLYLKGLSYTFLHLVRTRVVLVAPLTHFLFPHPFLPGIQKKWVPHSATKQWLTATPRLLKLSLMQQKRGKPKIYFCILQGFAVPMKRICMSVIYAKGSLWIRHSHLVGQPDQKQQQQQNIFLCYLNSLSIPSVCSITLTRSFQVHSGKRERWK